MRRSRGPRAQLAQVAHQAPGAGGDRTACPETETKRNGASALKEETGQPHFFTTDQCPLCGVQPVAMAAFQEMLPRGLSKFL